MSVNLKLKKDELKLVAEELGLSVPDGAKIVDLKNLIEHSDIYKNDKEFVQSVIDNVIEEKENNLALEKARAAQLERENENKIELEKIKLAQIEKEILLCSKRNETHELLKSEINSETESTQSLENLIKSVKTLTISVPSKPEAFNLFFQSLEKAFKTKNVPEEFKSEILLNLLGEKAKNLMIYISEKELKEYDKLKEIVLKEFQPTPRECINNFNKAQKMPGESFIQFATRLSAMFDYYCQLRNVSDFKSLCELIISDKIFGLLDRELMTHIAVRQGESFFKPQELGRECDIYLSSKVRPKQEINNFSPKNRDFRSSTRNISNVFLSEIKNAKCVICKGNEFHPLYLCPRFKNMSINERSEVVKINKLCFKCLSANCSIKKCNFKNCFCGKPHNKMIHFPRESRYINATVSNPPPLQGRK